MLGGKRVSVRAACDEIGGEQNIEIGTSHHDQWGYSSVRASKGQYGKSSCLPGEASLEIIDEGRWQKPSIRKAAGMPFYPRPGQNPKAWETSYSGSGV